MPDGLDLTFLPLRVLVRPALSLAFRVKNHGREHIPKTGAAILAANHASFLDPIFIAACARRPVRFLVSREFYRDKRLQPLLRFFGTIPVGGDGGLVRSFRLMTQVVRKGGLLGIFPEGGITRDGAMRPFRAGAATIALRMGVPVVPIHLNGTFAALPRYARWPRFVQVTLRIGNAIDVAPRSNPSSEEIAALTDILRNAIASLASTQG